MNLSPKALQLILNHEVGGGEAYYNARLRHPTWPGKASGITIGIGYDLGYNSESKFRGDWAAMDDDDRDRLAKYCGFRAGAARDRVRDVRDINIPWNMAVAVFTQTTVPRFIAETLQAFPGAEQLPSDAFGALVSLVFNRGPALEGKNRQDMQDIHNILADGVQAGDLKAIATQLREMKEIWRGQGLDGLLRRREDEARLVEGA